MQADGRQQGRSSGQTPRRRPRQRAFASPSPIYLRWADITRADLFADDATRRPLNFHDLRHTGITWRAVRGDDPLKVMRAAGHDDLATTQRYINEAQTFEPNAFGEPFPTVPGFGFSFGVSASVPPPKPYFSWAELRPYVDEFRTALVELAAAA